MKIVIEKSDNKYPRCAYCPNQSSWYGFLEKDDGSERMVPPLYVFCDDCKDRYKNES